MYLNMRIVLLIAVLGTPALAAQGQPRAYASFDIAATRNGSPEDGPLEAEHIPQAVKSEAKAAPSVVPALYEEPLGPRRDLRTSITTVVSSLAIVLGLFAVFLWVLRRAGVAQIGDARSGRLVEVLERLPLTASQQLHVVRFGERVVLVSASMSGTTALSEMSLREYQGHRLGRQPIEPNPAGYDTRRLELGTRPSSVAGYVGSAKRVRTGGSSRPTDAIRRESIE